METDHNVIPFPLPYRSRKTVEEYDAKEAEDLLIKSRMAIANDIVNVHASALISTIQRYGFDVDEDLFIEYMTNIELLRSLLFERLGLTHPLTKTRKAALKDMLESDQFGPALTEAYNMYQDEQLYDNVETFDEDDEL